MAPTCFCGGGGTDITSIISLQQGSEVCKQLLPFLPPHRARLVTHSVSSRVWHSWIPWRNATTHKLLSKLSNLVHHLKTNPAVEVTCNNNLFRILNIAILSSGHWEILDKWPQFSHSSEELSWGGKAGGRTQHRHHNLENLVMRQPPVLR